MHKIIDLSETKDNFKTKAKEDIDKRIDEIKNSNAYSSVQKIFLAETLRERVLVSIDIQLQVYEIRDIIDTAHEAGLSDEFADMLHSIVDRLEERLDVTESDIEKYEDIRQTRKEIEELIKEELLKLDQTIE